MTPRFSVVIPCRNGEATLGRQLDALLSQRTDESFEVVVADNGSTDRTAALVASRSAVDARVRRVDAGARPGINLARNAGVRASVGEFVLLCDADDTVHPGWLAAYAAAVDAGASCVGGGVDRTLASGRVIGRDRQLLTVQTCEKASPIGSNCGFSRAVFDAVGGFDETMAGGYDEIDFFWRAQDAGFDVTLVPDAVVTYLARSELREVFRQHLRYGRGEVALFLRHRGRGMPRPRPASSLKRTAVFAYRALRDGGPDRARFATELLAHQLGRVLESARSRTLYI